MPGLETAVDVATIPVKVVSSGVDAATTSQSEADQKRGREIRKREERLGRLAAGYQPGQLEHLDGKPDVRRDVPDHGELAHRDDQQR